MRSRRAPLLIAALVAALLTPGAAAAAPAPAAQAAVTSCSAAAWSGSAVYVGGNQVTHAGAAWRAKWWTQGETPAPSEWGVWQDLGAC